MFEHNSSKWKDVSKKTKDASKLIAIYQMMTFNMARILEKMVHFCICRERWNTVLISDGLRVYFYRTRRTGSQWSGVCPSASCAWYSGSDGLPFSGFGYKSKWVQIQQRNTRILKRRYVHRTLAERLPKTANRGTENNADMCSCDVIPPTLLRIQAATTLCQ